jgi:hypothetical protein
MDAQEFFKSEQIIASDGNPYSVVSSYGDKKRAADMIAEINQFVVELIKRLKKYELSPPDDARKAEYEKGREVYALLKRRFNPATVSENEPDSPAETSYTKNKGESISLCLREKESGQNKFHNVNVLKFVMVHELAHIITPEYEHSQNFWSNFRFLLEFCRAEGIYTSPDYASDVVRYCGMDIKYNPLYDTRRATTYFK